MRVKLLVPRSGPKGSFNRGEEIDVDAEEAKRMFAARPPQAVPVKASKKEKASKDLSGAERAAK